MESNLIIYYKKSPMFKFMPDIDINKDPIRALTKKYTKMYERNVKKPDNMEDIYKILNEMFTVFNNNNNPLLTEEKSDYILQTGTFHTSMSVKDIIQIDNRYFEVKGVRI